MAATGVRSDPRRDLVRRLRERAQFHLDSWRECNLDAAAIEAELPEAKVEHVTVKPIQPKREPYEVTVREIAYELTQAGATFLTADIVSAGVPYQTALKWLKEWETRGMLESIQEGRELHWARSIHASEPVNRPRTEAPEAAVIAFERSRSPVEGSGRGHRITDPGIRALLDQCRQKGAQVNKLGSGHYEVRKGGKRIAVVSATPSDHRSVPNARAEIRRNGLPV